MFSNSKLFTFTVFQFINFHTFFQKFKIVQFSRFVHLFFVQFFFQARLFDEPQLAALCLETIDKNTPEALGAEGFTDIDINTLSAVLDRDSLRIKEAKLFSAVIKWSEAECVRQNLQPTPENKRGVLGRILASIRFPLMAVEEFAQGPAQSGILTDRECVSLFLHFTVNPKPPVGFLDVPRCSMTGKEQTVGRYSQIESRWGYSGMSDKIRYDKNP